MCENLGETGKKKRPDLKGNQFWKFRKDMSFDGKKLSLKKMRERLEEYINDVQTSPLYEIDYRGKNNEEVELPKMRGMSIEGACLYLGISTSTWAEWRKAPKYLEIIAQAELIIFTYSLEGAEAGLLNQSIVARKLGLTDKQHIEVVPEQPLFP